MLPLQATLVLASLHLCSPRPRPSAQETAHSTRPDTTLVTATREASTWLEAPNAVTVIEAEDSARSFARTAPRSLDGTPGASVQETGPGQGSPYLRGFTGYQTLVLIDGIRLNNSVFRSGPNQYFGTVDPYALERLEVVRGPSSVLYGSDALGGTIHALTKGPNTWGAGHRHSERLYYRFASAETSDVVRGEVSSTWGERTGLFLGADGKWFDDVSGGRDIGTQENTGYDEWAGDLKFEQRLGRGARVVFAHQRLEQDDAPRTHRTLFAESFEGTAVGTDRRHDFDQERSLTYLQFHAEDQGGDALHASLSWHDQEETLKRVTGGGAASQQGFDVGTLGLFAYAASDSGIGRLTYGADWYRDGVDSFSTTNSIQGPVADDSRYDLLGFFLQDEVELSARTTLTLGGRFNHAAVEADSVFDPVTSTQTDLDDDWSALVGSARFLHRLEAEHLHLFGGVSQGFRAPNLSDLTRLDSARSNEFELPSPGLDPEYTTNYELGLKSQGARLASQVALFYTDVRDLILRRPTGNVNASGQAEVVKENVGDGEVYGVEAEAALRVGVGWELFAGASYVYGEVETFPTSAPVAESEPLDKLMPLTAQLGARWEDERHWFELVAQGAGDADELSSADELDTQRIPPGGTPGYVVLHLRGGLRLGRHAALDLGLENVLDEDYRVHGSGLNRAGRSLTVGLSLVR
jgi:hemoglobin/transferrin/lactoferrin receptor protein